MNTGYKDIIERVRKDLDSRNQVIKELYENTDLCDTIKSYVMKHDGQTNDANDLIVSSIMVFIKQCYRPLFELNKTAEAYIYSVAKYQWIKICKQKNKFVIDGESKIVDLEESIESVIINRERKIELKRALSNLDSKCRNVLTLWSSSLKMREIALQMGYKSDGMARKKKHECLKKLKSLIKNI